MSKYWYCVKHKTVETENLCPPVERLGPYDSQEAAERALETAEERNEDWESDPAWNDDLED